MKKTINNSYQTPVNPKEEEIFRYLESDECLGSKVISEDASVLEKTKYELCQTITCYQIQNKLNEEKMTSLLGLDKLATAKLLRGYIENFSLDSLISYVERLNIPCQVKITPKIPLILARKSSNERVKKHA